MEAPKFETTFLEKVIRELNPKYDRTQYGLRIKMGSLKEETTRILYWGLNGVKSAVRGGLAGLLVGATAKTLGATQEEALALTQLIASADVLQYIIRSDIIPAIKGIYTISKGFK